MPSTYAHKWFGERVFDCLPNYLQEKINTHKQAFYLGLHGPDVLFNYKPLSKKSLRKASLQIHFAPAKDFFLSAAQKLTLLGDDPVTTAEGAYVAGFLCHFLLDDACHGDVFRLEATGVSHARIEAEFDKKILRLDGKKIRGYNPAKHLTAKNGCAKAAATFLDKPEKVIEKAVKTMRTVNGLFCFPFEPLHWVLHLIMKTLKIKFGEMFFRLKTDKRCVGTCQIMTEHLENAILPSAAFIEEYFSSLKTIVQTGELNKIFDNDFLGDKSYESIK